MKTPDSLQLFKNIILIAKLSDLYGKFNKKKPVYINTHKSHFNTLTLRIRGY